MMGHKQSIGLLFGGQSPEHEISVISARSVFEHLDRTCFEPVLVYVSCQGLFYVYDDFTTFDQGGEGHVVDLEPTGEGLNLKQVNGQTIVIDCYFPLFHGPGGEDGTVQGLLEFSNAHYVGCNHLSAALLMDKAITKRLLASTGLHVTPFHVFSYDQWQQQPNWIRQAVAELGLPCFVKPVNVGSSLGMSKVNHLACLNAAIDSALNYDYRFLVERAVEDARDLEIALLGGEWPDVSQPGEVIADGDFYDYYAKYESEATQLEVPASIDCELLTQLQQQARTVYQIAGAYGMLRVDFLLRPSDNTLFFSEANSIPGFTSISLYPKLWQFEGLSYDQLLTRLIQLAYQRPSTHKTYLARN
jgi:D-alanine-D-alanine ligase